MRNFRAFDFWVDAKDLAVDTVNLVKTFPREEQFSLCNQLRRASVSIASNIAEGAGRGSNNDFAHFLNVAIGSAYEMETQIEITKGLDYIDLRTFNLFISRIQSIERRMTAFLKVLRESNIKSQPKSHSRQ